MRSKPPSAGFHSVGSRSAFPSCATGGILGSRGRGVGIFGGRMVRGAKPASVIGGEVGDMTKSRERVGLPSWRRASLRRQLSEQYRKELFGMTICFSHIAQYCKKLELISSSSKLSTLKSSSLFEGLALIPLLRAVFDTGAERAALNAVFLLGWRRRAV